MIDFNMLKSGRVLRPMPWTRAARHGSDDPGGCSQDDSRELKEINMNAALLDAPRPATNTPASNLRANMAAVRVSFTWLGTRKSLSPSQRAEAAQPFDAEGGYLSAGKKLLDTSDSAFKAVTSIKSKIASMWKSMSLPFPEPGVRLIRRDKIDEFVGLMTDYKVELAEAVANLDNHYGELQQAARERLGRLFNPGDYPETLIGLFDVSWDFPSVEPPDYLRELNPALYEAERARVAARFDEAVQLAEQAFLDEFAKLVGHLAERISGGEDGEKKVFRDSAVGNLGEFFERFKSLNVRSNDQLDELVAQAQQAVRGVGAQDLRQSSDLRQRVASQLSSVRSALDGLMVDKPRRRIIRPTTNQGEMS